jgi:acyl-CoA thioester hydrolase
VTAHVHRIRVRYAETDQMGVAHHASFVIWCEEARIAWLRASGASYRDLEASGVLMPVVDLHLRYLRPLRFDDEAVLTTTATRVGRVRLSFATTIDQGADRCAEAVVVVAATDRGGRPVRLPDGLAV